MNNIEKQLHNLRNITPDSMFRDRMHAMVSELPDLRPRAAMPLVAFRLALAGVTLLLLGSLGTGVLLAAKGSNPGSILYPIKQAVDVHHVPFFSTPVASPTAMPSFTVPEHHSVQSVEEHENEHEGVGATSSAHHANNEEHQDVKGVSVHQGDEEKMHQQTISPSPLQDMPSNIKLHTDEESDN